jgi:hypothetical protein
VGNDTTAQFAAEGVHHATINGHRFHLRLNADARQQHLLWIDGQQPPLILDATAARFMVLLIDAMWEFQQGDGDETPKSSRPSLTRCTANTAVPGPLAVIA